MLSVPRAVMCPSVASHLITMSLPLPTRISSLSAIAMLLPFDAKSPPSCGVVSSTILLKPPPALTLNVPSPSAETTPLLEFVRPLSLTLVIASSGILAVVTASSGILAVVTASSAILAVVTALLAIFAEVTLASTILVETTIP